MLIPVDTFRSVHVRFTRLKMAYTDGDEATEFTLRRPKEDAAAAPVRAGARFF